jgi:hypothetical protein
MLAVLNIRNIFKIIQGLERSHDNKKLKEAEYSLECLGLNLGIAITLNPSPMPPPDSELMMLMNVVLK